LQTAFTNLTCRSKPKKDVPRKLYDMPKVIEGGRMKYEGATCGEALMIDEILSWAKKDHEKKTFEPIR